MCIYLTPRVEIKIWSKEHVYYTCPIALRSTAQLISYELILSSAILLVVLLAGSLDITVIIEAQRAI
jgi:NADH:ubiquinone oxidoreductase subunit H